MKMQKSASNEEHYTSHPPGNVWSVVQHLFETFLLDETLPKLIATVTK